LSSFKYAFFLLIFSSCIHSYALAPASNPIRKATYGNQIACPSRDFSKFIVAFSERKEVQMMFTRYPLKHQRLDIDAEPEPIPIVRRLRRDQVLFPVIPNEAERKQKSLVLRIDEGKSNHVKLTVIKTDSDYQIVYFFNRSSCWYLQRIEDWSL
jgi:hypothetical protein